MKPVDVRADNGQIFRQTGKSKQVEDSTPEGGVQERALEI